MQDTKKQKKIVVIGGGTGSFTALNGLKQHPVHITAIVTMFDSGGSSGLLRDEFGVLPPGDIRRCLIALSDEKEQKILRELFAFRFKEGSSLRGHSFGNLFLTALSTILKDESAAIKKAGELLKIKGRVLPVSTSKSHLFAKLQNGETIKGEKNIDIPKHNGEVKIEKVFLKPKAFLNKEAEAAILKADVVVIGPGDLYTSLIPNLLVQGMKEALKKSKAKKVFVLNLMTKWGETNNLSAAECAREVLSYSGLSEFDYIICNDKKMPERLLRAYKKEKKYPIIADSSLTALGKRIIKAPLFKGDDIVRHDSKALAKILTTL